MATKPFDRMALNVAERPLSTDINQLQSDAQLTRMFMLDWLLRGHTNTGSGADAATARSQALGPLQGAEPTAAFLGDAFFVKASTPPGLSLVISAGLGFYRDPSDVPTGIGGLLGADDLSPIKPLPIFSDLGIIVPTPGGSARVDIIEVKIDRRLEQPLSRDILNISTGQVFPNTVNKVLAHYLDETRVSTVDYNQGSTGGIGYKKGQLGGGVPATTVGYAKIAEIDVGAGVGTITQDKVADTRLIALPGGATVFGGKIDVAHDGTNIVSLGGNFRVPPGFRFCVSFASHLSASGMVPMLIGGGGSGNVIMHVHAPGESGGYTAGFATTGGADGAIRTLTSTASVIGSGLATAAGTGSTTSYPQTLLSARQLAWVTAALPIAGVGTGGGNHRYLFSGMVL